jgi:hypothetical protein
MKNLLEYHDWLSSQWLSFNGVACLVLDRNRREGWIRLKTPNGIQTVREEDPDLRPIDDISLPLFLQIGAPTIAF